MADCLTEIWCRYWFDNKKSVKSRIDKMFSSGVIDRFLAVVNHQSLGTRERTLLLFGRTSLIKSLSIEFIWQAIYNTDLRCLGVIGFGIAIKEENEEKIQLLLDSLRPAIVGGCRANKRILSNKDRVSSRVDH